MKFKSLTIATFALLLMSCGSSNSNDSDVSNDNDTTTESASTKTNNMSQETATNNKEVASFIHGAVFAMQLKQQNLTFLNPDLLLTSFAKFKSEGLSGFSPQAEIPVLREIAQKSGNFANMTPEDSTTATEIFSKLFYTDITESKVGQLVDQAKFEEGLKDFWENEQQPSQDSIKIYTDFIAEIEAKEGRTFLEENAKKDNIQVTESGLQYEVIEEGDGKSPVATDKVLAHYEGTLIDGTIFDSSYERGEPTEFPLNAVIAGWTEGLQLMKTGAKYKFYIPFELGYGARGSQPKIPPYAALVFTVELIEIK